MRHYSSNAAESVVLLRRPSEVIRKGVAELLFRVVDLGNSLLSEEITLHHIEYFVFDGDRNSATRLRMALSPSEFRSVCDARIWYKKIDEQFKYRSSEFWTRTGDFVYVNLNSGRSLVLIDGHYWAE